MSRVPSKTTVAVLLGGWSAEREVSLSSGKACTAALERAGFRAVPIDVKRETIVAELQRVKPDVAFNALHGKWGEDGCCAAILETLQIAYTHSGVLASSLAMHKEKSKIVFRAAGVPVAESLLVSLEDVAAGHPMRPPYVVKPVAEGSSVGVHIVLEGANAPVKAVLDERAIFGSHAMVERFVPGRELTCAVIGGSALGVIDIVSKVGTTMRPNMRRAARNTSSPPKSRRMSTPSARTMRWLPTMRWAAAACHARTFAMTTRPAT
jgi:D-alanine-D-alanine ligase